MLFQDANEVIVSESVVLNKRGYEVDLPGKATSGQHCPAITTEGISGIKQRIRTSVAPISNVVQLISKSFIGVIRLIFPDWMIVAISIPAGPP